MNYLNSNPQLTAVKTTIIAGKAFALYAEVYTDRRGVRVSHSHTTEGADSYEDAIELLNNKGYVVIDALTVQP